MSIEALQTLCEVRLAAERQAEQALARAVVALRQTRQRQLRLADELAAARAQCARARAVPPVPSSAGALQAAQRYLQRLEAEAAAAARAADDHQRGSLATATEAEARAREQHLRARARREAVERAVTRRQAARRRDQERRAEAAADDLAQRRGGRNR